MLIPDLSAGLSDLTQQIRSGDISRYKTVFSAGNSPEERYQKFKDDASALNFITYPPDIPDHRIVLVARDYFSALNPASSINIGKGVAKSGYVLPLPSMQLNDRYQISYDDNFAFLEMLRTRPIVFATRFAAAAGLNLNKFKTILMEAPMIKRHQFAWKFSPKSVQESRLILRMVNRLKSDMAPELNLGGLVYTFPYIFDVYFDPNPNWFYGFKPCVIESLDVDYDGGNSQPAVFYNGAPESIVMSMVLIEMEVWTKRDYDKWNEGVESGELNPTDTVRPTGIQDLRDRMFRDSSTNPFDTTGTAGF